MTECLLKKDCPFCGSRAVFIGRDNHGVYIQCLDCDAHMYHFTDPTDENKLAEIWNRRAEDKPKVPFGITINGDVGYECPHCMAVYSAGCLPDDKICEFCHKDMRVKE